MAFRFVHTADVHLDSPLRSLALRDPEVAAVVGGATRQAFVRVVDLCLDEAVDALMIAGDLFDGDLRSMKTALFFGRQMQRLSAAGIRVFIVRGNHDALCVLSRQLSLPAGVHVFGGRAETVVLESFGVAVHGLSYTQAHAPESLLAKYRPPVDGLCNIGLLHTSVAGAPGHDPYAPCTVAELRAHGYQYWGLGHVHKAMVHHDDADCTIVMPGMPQGRDIGEAGPKTAALVSVTDEGQRQVQMRATSVAEFMRVRIDLSGVRDDAGVLAALRTALQQARMQATSPDVIVRLQAVGATVLHRRLARDHDLWWAEAQQVARALPHTYIEGLRFELQPPVRAEDSEGMPLDELERLVASEVQDSLALRQAAAAVVRDLQAQLPAALRSHFGDDDEALAACALSHLRRGSVVALAHLAQGTADEQT